LAEKVAVQIAEQIEKLPRAEIAAASLVHRGGAILVESVEHALEVANAYAPEHLQLSVTDPMRWLGTVQNAGAVFLGEHSFEVLGDYVAGPSHSLPTGGTARFSSGINVLDFVKLIAVIGLEEKAASQLSRSAAIIAEAEGLNGHAAAARRRIKKDA
jgi:histidinol dehydrogenase